MGDAFPHSRGIRCREGPDGPFPVFGAIFPLNGVKGFLFTLIRCACCPGSELVPPPPYISNIIQP